jgi:hypothetical protein
MREERVRALSEPFVYPKAARCKMICVRKWVDFKCIWREKGTSFAVVMKMGVCWKGTGKVHDQMESVVMVRREV